MPTPGNDFQYINNAGSIGLEIINPVSPGSGGTNVITAFDTHGKLIPNDPNSHFVSGSTYVRMTTYADGSIQQSLHTQADGSQIDLFYDDTNQQSVAYGPGLAYSIGPLNESVYDSASGYTKDQHFAGGQLTQYDFVYQDIELHGLYNSVSGTSTLSFQNNTYNLALNNVIHDFGAGNINSLIGNDGSSLIGNDGSSLIGNDGSSLNLLDTSSLIGNDGSSLIGNDGSSLISQDGAGIQSADHLIGNDGSSVNTPGSSLIGNDGSSFGFNTLAMQAANLTQVRQFTFVDDPNESSSATTDSVSVGGSTSGTLEKLGDRDWLRVDLTAGQAYQIDVKGAATNDGTLVDPWLRVYDSGSTLLVQIDDGGVRYNSRLLFTPTATGTYYVEASSRGDASTGSYTVSVANIPLTITIDPVAGDNLLDAEEQAADSVQGLVISGTTTGIQVAHAITVSLNGHNYDTSVAADGTWQATVAGSDVAALAPGSQQVSASVDGTSTQATENFSVAGTIDQAPYTTLNDPLSVDSTSAFGINNAGDIVGFYNGSDGYSHRFRESNGTYTTLDDATATQGAVAQGINDSGQIDGSYSDSNGPHGFLDSAGTYTTLDDLSGTRTHALGINASGQIVGDYFNVSGTHGFLDTKGTYTDIDDPSASGFTQARGINTSGQIVGAYSSSDSREHGFLYSNGKYTTLDDPSASGGVTEANGINASGQIVGQYEDSNSVVHGFL